MNALKEAEGAGQGCERKGASGEGGCWQFMPSTWDKSVVEVYGEWKPRDSYTRERYVVTKLVEKWVNQGKSAAEIGLIWNAGGAKECSRGVNRHGIKYDSCAHVAKVLAYLNRHE